MRIKISKKIKKVMVIVSVIVIAAFLYLIFKEMNEPDYMKESFPVYAYRHRGEIDYNVLLKPNVLYDEPSLEEGKIYITELLQNINAIYAYDFKGERPCNIHCEYDITASVEGFGMLSKEEQEGGNASASANTIWKKDFAVYPKTNLTSQDGTLSISKDITIDFNQYKTFAAEILEITKLSLQTRLTVSMNIHLTADTDKGIIAEEQTLSLAFPLNANSFKISKTELPETPGALEETRKIPVDKKSKMQPYYICIGFMALVLLFLVVFTTGVNGVTPHKKELNKIFKKHGNRLVAVSSEISTNYQNHCTVRTMDDLIRLADEVGKPVIYRFSENSEEITQFLVFTETWMYVFDIKNIIEPSKPDMNEEKTIKNRSSKEKSDFKSRVKPVPFNSELLNPKAGD